MDPTTITYTTTVTGFSSDASTGLWAMLMAMMLVIVFMGLAVYIVCSIFMGKIFQKAGVKFWKAWVPVYNVIKFLQIGGQNPLLILLNLIPFVGSIIFLVFSIIAAINIDKKLGKSGAFVLLYVFISPVWMGVNGLDKSIWDDSLGAASLAPETATIGNNQPTEPTMPTTPTPPTQQPPVSGSPFAPIQ